MANQYAAVLLGSRGNKLIRRASHQDISGQNDIVPGLTKYVRYRYRHILIKEKSH
jgi:hypothetical protein